MSESEPDALRRSLRLLWPNLPVLLTGSVLVAAGWVLVRAISNHFGSISILGVGLLVVPLFAALLNAAESLLDDDHVAAEIVHDLRAVATLKPGSAHGGANVSDADKGTLQ